MINEETWTTNLLSHGIKDTSSQGTTQDKHKKTTSKVIFALELLKFQTCGSMSIKVSTMWVPGIHINQMTKSTEKEIKEIIERQGLIYSRTIAQLAIRNELKET